MKIINEPKINYKQLSEEIKKDFLKEAEKAGFTEEQAEFLYEKCRRSFFDTTPF